MSGLMTPGPWHLSGVRFRMNGGEWQNISHYDEQAKCDINIAVVSIDARTLEGIADGHLIAAAPDLLAVAEALELVVSVSKQGKADGRYFIDERDMAPLIAAARAAIVKTRKFADDVL